MSTLLKTTVWPNKDRFLGKMCFIYWVFEQQVQCIVVLYVLFGPPDSSKDFCVYKIWRTSAKNCTILLSPAYRRSAFAGVGLHVGHAFYFPNSWSGKIFPTT